MLQLIVYIALIGLVLWLVTTYIPMPEQIKTLLVVVVVILIVLWLVQAIAGGAGGVGIPRLR
jgi:hypothetical protein